MPPFIKTNFHTHSTFCDGKSTLEESVISAIQKQIKILGFSGHSVYPAFFDTCNMKIEDFTEYTKQIRLLKEKYKEQIEILLGFEADFVPSVTKPDFYAYREFNPDFLIGSVHYLRQNEQTHNDFFAVDNSPDFFLEGLKTLYNGSIKKLIGHYFSTQRQMLKEGNFTIIGHPDLVRKFNGILKLFTEKEDWYIAELKETAKAIKKAGVIAEINTGAISRGYDVIYPSEYFLSLLHENYVPVTINSDCHDCRYLDCAFDKAMIMAKKAGYNELACLKEKKVIFQKIEY